MGRAAGLREPRGTSTQRAGQRRGWREVIREEAAQQTREACEQEGAFSGPVGWRPGLPWEAVAFVFLVRVVQWSSGEEARPIWFRRE